MPRPAHWNIPGSCQRPLDDQLSTLEPNQLPGTFAQPPGTHLQPPEIIKPPARGCQKDEEHAESSHAKVIQPTTIQVAVARYIDLPVDNNVEQIVICSHTGPSTGDKQTQEYDKKLPQDTA
jgi:hypothetical protein